MHTQMCANAFGAFAEAISTPSGVSFCSFVLGVALRMCPHSPCFVLNAMSTFSVSEEVISKILTRPYLCSESDKVMSTYILTRSCLRFEFLTRSYLRFQFPTRSCLCFQFLARSCCIPVFGRIRLDILIRVRSLLPLSLDH